MATTMLIEMLIEHANINVDEKRTNVLMDTPAAIPTSFSTSMSVSQTMCILLFRSHFGCLKTGIIRSNSDYGLMISNQQTYKNTAAGCGIEDRRI